MKVNPILGEIFREKWAISPNVAANWEPIIAKLLTTHDLQVDHEHRKYIQLYGDHSASMPYDDVEDDEDMQPMDPETLPDDSVIIANIIGETTKYSGMSSIGTDQLAQEMLYFAKSSKVSGIVLRIHSGGGSTSSIIPMIAATEKISKEFAKPIVALVDNMAMSAAYMIASMADRIIAVDEMAEVGSIGVFATITDTRKMMENEGVKRIEIYAPESSEKNRGYRDALEGDYNYMIETSLSPFAKYMADFITKRRPNLGSEAGILSGAVYYAKDAQKLGLIDSIGSMESAVSMVRNMRLSRIIQSKIM